MKKYLFTAIGLATIAAVLMFTFNVVGCEASDKDSVPTLDGGGEQVGEPVEADDVLILDEVQIDTSGDIGVSDVEKAIETQVGPDVAHLSPLRCRVYSRNTVCGANHWMFAGRRLAMVQREVKN